MGKLNIKSALRIFECYILPTITYGTAVWYGKCSKQSMDALDTIFTKFIKMHLQIPFNFSNAITYHITSTVPLQKKIKLALMKAEDSLKRQWNIYLI